MKAAMEDRTPRSSGETEEEKNINKEGGKKRVGAGKGKTDRKKKDKAKIFRQTES